MNYQVVFDIKDAGYSSWSFPAHGLIVVGIGIVIFAARKNLPGWWRNHPRASSVFASVFLGFSTIWTLAAFVSTYSQYSHLSTAITDGSIRTVEGRVENFKPMPVSGRAMERFCVGGQCFEYSDYVITGGFNNTSSHGGPIKENLPVRVTYIGNTIVKLEVAQ